MKTCYPKTEPATYGSPSTAMPRPGILSELFVPDLTAARASVPAVGRTRIDWRTRRLRAWDGPGDALSPGCDMVVMRIARTPTHVWVDARGATSIVVTAPR